MNNSNRANRNASRDIYNATSDAVIQLPPILSSKFSHLPPEDYTYGKPSIWYNKDHNEKQPAESVLNGAFAWKSHEQSKATELG